MEPDGDRPGTTGYMNSSAGTSSDHAPCRAAGSGLPQELRSLRDLAKAAIGAVAASTNTQVTTLIKTS